MFGVELRVAAVEVAHFTGPNIRSANSKAGGMAVDLREIHQFVQCARAVPWSRTQPNALNGVWEPVKANGLGLKKPGTPRATVSQFTTSPPNKGHGAIA
jgi:hypothetical protein